MKHNYITLIFGVVLGFSSHAQHYNVTLERYTEQLIEREVYAPSLEMHTAIKPYNFNEVKKVIDMDTAAGVSLPSKSFYSTRFGRKIFNESLLNLQKENYSVYVDPLFDFSYGQQGAQGLPSLYTNSRGARIMGSLGRDFSFHTQFLETQAVFPEPISGFAFRNTVAPGFGRVKAFGTNGYDFAWATGYISYRPSKFFNFQFGHDKHFWGDGYRSLFLSDNAFNYPFLKITTNFWRFQYTNLFTSFQNIGNAGNSGLGGFPKKYATFHHLSYNINKRLNVGIFETVIWQNNNPDGSVRGFDVNYLNPIIFYRPVEFSLGSPDNVLIGFNFKALPFKKTILHGQLVLDEFFLKEVRAGNGWWANKQAFQLGLKQFDFLGVKNLQVQAEYNRVRPYTYGHFTAAQSFTHFAQPLAHPLGANFTEALIFVRYQWKRFATELRFSNATFGVDTIRIINNEPVLQNLGNNIFLPATETQIPSIYNNKMYQGLKTNLNIVQFTFSYLINIKTNMRLELQVWNRIEENQKFNIRSNWVNFSFKTSLPNKTWDF